MIPEKLQAARFLMIADRPYMATALYALHCVEVDRIQYGGFATLGVDKHWRLYYDKIAIEKWSVPQLSGVLYHETMHLLRDHHHRQERKVADPKIWNVACLPTGTLLADGTPIEAAPAKVLSGNGWVDAIPMSRPYKGDMIRLAAQGLGMDATPEHPFLVYRKLRQTDVTPSRRGIIPDPEWVDAGNLKPGDYVVVPNLPGEASAYKLPVEQFMAAGEDGCGRNRVVLKDGFPLNAKTAWLLGLYCAEGSGLDAACLSLGPTECDMADRAVAVIREHLGYEAYHEPSKSGIRVYLGGPVLARAMKAWCGDGSHNKRIPNFILQHEDLTLVRAFIEGVLEGDGHDRPSSRSHDQWKSIGTSSRTLDRQLRMALARLGIGSHGGPVPQKEGRVLNGAVLPAGMLYGPHWRWEPKLSARELNGRQVTTNGCCWKRVPEGIAIPIREVKALPYEGMVFNMNTSDHSYVAEALITHNCDMEINDDLKNEKVTLPPGGVYPSSYEFPDGELVEQYYERLIEKRDGGGGGGGFLLKIDGPAGGQCGSCAGGEAGPWELGAPSDGNHGVSEAAGELIRLKTAEDIVAELESGGKSRGTVPSSLERWAREKLKPKVDWRKVLGGLLRQTVADIAGLVDYSYSKPARRQSVSNGIIFPALRHPLPLVAVVIDTSGSMSEHELAIAVTEVGGILKKIGLRDGLTVIPVDAAVHSCKRVFTPNQIQLAGGGGTDMGVGIEKAATLRPKPAACVVLTDGLTGWPATPVPGMKTVAAIIGDPGGYWNVPAHIKKIIIPKEALTQGELP